MISIFKWVSGDITWSPVRPHQKNNSGSFPVTCVKASLFLFDHSDGPVSRVLQHYSSCVQRLCLLFVWGLIQCKICIFELNFLLFNFVIWISLNLFFIWIFNFITSLLLAENVLTHDSTSNIFALLPSLVSPTELVTFSSYVLTLLRRIMIRVGPNIDSLSSPSIPFGFSYSLSCASVELCNHVAHLFPFSTGCNEGLFSGRDRS